jgi:hypothetical protein
MLWKLLSLSVFVFLLENGWGYASVEEAFEGQEGIEGPSFSLQPFIIEQTYKTVRLVMNPLGVEDEDILNLVAQRLLETEENKEERCVIQALSVKVPLYAPLTLDQWKTIISPEVVHALNVYDPGTNPYVRTFPEGVIELISVFVSQGADLPQIIALLESPLQVGLGN